ncbi:Structural maintenance of chromosomes protein [Operophtera brumata]|uniref:Structural maintenance of chromosomes protein n=1 Tax=Operophtera brumata TaxID=104452 RepID=A0A0L7LT74_OPEBR|nr:Structural maintenance of chromosomes protein [Operophtera brumata]
MEIDDENIEEDIDGCIHSIHVRNFFCHENLEVTLNRNVNFIVGRNGSGKSAVLTALVVGLGGRASATNRGSSLSSFIKKGQNSATIEIKIKNNSSKAFKPNVYGDYITIKKYSLFRKATNLDLTEGNYVRALENCTKAIAIWTKKKDLQSRDEIEAQKQALQNEYYWSEIADFEKEANTIQAQHDKQKAKMEKLAEKLKKMEQNYGSNNDAIQALKTHLTEKTQERTALEQELRSLETEVREVQGTQRSTQHSSGKQRELMSREQRKVADLEREIRNIESGNTASARATLEKRAEAARAAAASAEARYDTAQNDASQARQNLAHAQAQAEQQLKQQARELESRGSDSLAVYGNNMVELSQRLKRAVAKGEFSAPPRGPIEQLKQQARELESRGSDSLAVYGNNMVELSQRLKRAVAKGQFSAPPRGPIEQLKQQARELESRGSDSLAVYGNNMVELSQRLKRAVAKGEFSAPPYAGPLVRTLSEQLKQQARELESRGSDSLAVYGKNMVELSQRLKRAVPKGEFSAPPRGPIGAYTFRTTEAASPRAGVARERLAGGLRQQHGGAEPATQASPLEHIIGGSMQSFCVNTSEDSRKLFDIMGQVYGRAPKPSVTCSKFLSKAHDVRRNKVHASGFLSALDSVDVSDPVVANYLIDNVSMESILLVPDHENCSKIVTLDSSEYYPAPNYRSYGGAGRHSRLLQVSTAERKKQIQAEILEAESALRTVEAQGEKLSGEATEAPLRHETSEAAQQAAAALQQENTPHHAVLVCTMNVERAAARALQSLSALRHETSEAAQHAAAALQQEERVTKYSQRIREDRIKLTQVEAIMEEKREVIQRKEQEALTLCTRIRNPRDKAVVTNELKKTQLKLSSIRSDGLTKAQVAEKLLEVERKYRRTKVTLDRLKLLIEDIKTTSDKHLNFCHQVQTYIARRVQYCFQSILTLRGFSILCTGRESSSKRHASSTSSLSGGERSYSTVAFIMALWECVELPFYFMDEFDIVMELLIDHALKNTSRQFVFLTPQDASSVQAGPQISIHL